MKILRSTVGMALVAGTAVFGAGCVAPRLARWPTRRRPPGCRR